MKTVYGVCIFNTRVQIFPRFPAVNSRYNGGTYSYRPTGLSIRRELYFNQATMWINGLHIPVIAAVGCMKNDSELPQCPAFLLVYEIYVNYRFSHSRGSKSPCFTAIGSVIERAAFSANPASIAIQEENPDKASICDYLFSPISSTVYSIKQHPAIAYNPSFFIVNKFYFVQPNVSAAILIFPVLSAVRSVDNRTFIANDPAIFGIQKIYVPKICFPIGFFDDFGFHNRLRFMLNNCF